MAELQSTGYQAAAAAVVFSGTQTMQSLATDEWTNFSDSISNSSNYVMADFECVLESAAFTANDQVNLYIIPILDATDPDWTGNVATEEQQNEQYFVGAFVTTGDTNAQRIMLRNIPLPPGSFRIGVRNKTAVSFTAQNNVINWRPHSYQSI